MAGAGAKKFPAFSKLSSDDVNNYLADQVIMRFATTTARDAAFGGVGEPTLAEGMTAYIDADNSIYTYDGSNWVKMVSASTPPALEYITAGALSGTTRDFVGCFTSNFTNYRITIDGFVPNTTADLFFRMLTGSTPSANNSYFWSIGGFLINGTALNAFSQGSTRGFTGLTVATNNEGWCELEIFTPQVSGRKTAMLHQSSGFDSTYFSRSGMTVYNDSSSFDGIRFLTDSAATMSGTVRIYGYRN